MIERRQEPYILRYDPVLIARLIEMKRAEMGEVRVTVSKKRAR